MLYRDAGAGGGVGIEHEAPSFQPEPNGLACCVIASG